MYATPLREGKRCIAVCEGYYEWKSTKNAKNKQPYFIYAEQESSENVGVILGTRPIELRLSDMAYTR